MNIVTTQPLSLPMLTQIDAYWRAANYLSVGQIYLYANPLLRQPLQLLGAIFTPLALFTLGAQIAAAKSLRMEALPQAVILTLKLAVSPLITLYLCRLMGVPLDVTQVMVVAAATPVGVLITIFAAELEAEPEFISTATVISTALSPLTVTAWIIVARLL